jgi:hypothetical protein
MRREWIAASIILTASPALAQSACGPTGQVEKSITEKYGERLIGAGVLQQGGGILFILSNPTTGSFTVLVRKQGMTCAVMSGQGYAIQDPPIPGTKT